MKTTRRTDAATNTTGDTKMSRLDAEKAYKKALADWNKSQFISEEAFNAADAALYIARKNLVDTEIKQPTYKEIKKQNEVLRLRNRGLDV